MKETINKGIANPHTQHQWIANPLELEKQGVLLYLKQKFPLF